MAALAQPQTQQEVENQTAEVQLDLHRELLTRTEWGVIEGARLAADRGSLPGEEGSALAESHQMGPRYYSGGQAGDELYGRLMGRLELQQIKGSEPLAREASYHAWRASGDSLSEQGKNNGGPASETESEQVGVEEGPVAEAQTEKEREAAQQARSTDEQLEIALASTERDQREAGNPNANVNNEREATSELALFRASEEPRTIATREREPVAVAAVDIGSLNASLARREAESVAVDEPQQASLTIDNRQVVARGPLVAPPMPHELVAINGPTGTTDGLALANNVVPFNRAGATDRLSGTVAESPQPQRGSLTTPGQGGTLAAFPLATQTDGAPIPPDTLARKGWPLVEDRVFTGVYDPEPREYAVA